MPQTTMSPNVIDFPGGSNSDTGEMMTFRDHLAELRQRFIVCAVVFTVATGGVFYFATPLILLLQKLTPAATVFVQLTPGEVFLSSFKLAVFGGVGLSLPVILYHVFRFLSPGLEHKERRLLMPLLTLALGLFCTGVFFGYRVILPLMLNFLLDYGQTVAQNQLSIAAFLDFCSGFLFASGLIFQVPLCLLFGALMGLLTSGQLLRQWRWALVASFLLGAIITPSADPFSQVVMASALFGLYGFSVVLIKCFKR